VLDNFPPTPLHMRYHIPGQRCEGAVRWDCIFGTSYILDNHIYIYFFFCIMAVLYFSNSGTECMYALSSQFCYNSFFKFKFNFFLFYSSTGTQIEVFTSLTQHFLKDS